MKATCRSTAPATRLQRWPSPKPAAASTPTHIDSTVTWLGVSPSLAAARATYFEYELTKKVVKKPS